jgi:DNA adenine methylase
MVRLATSITLFDMPPQELKPPLKWAGGKRWLVPRLKELYPTLSKKRLIEPFVGGMAVSLGLMPNKALLNDANPHLINFYCWLKKGLVVKTHFENDSELYYKHRDRFNGLIAAKQETTQEAAELFYYLNRTGFNGLCRFSSKGFFNVPFGKYKNITYTRDFRLYKDILENWAFQLGDFSSLSVGVSDWLYLDPPYDVEFTAYSAGGFTWNDQLRLAEWASSQNVPIIASNQATPRIIALYKDLGFSMEIIKAPRRISCNGDRTPADEALITKGI